MLYQSNDCYRAIQGGGIQRVNVAAPDQGEVPGRIMRPLAPGGG